MEKRRLPDSHIVDAEVPVASGLAAGGILNIYASTIAIACTWRHSDFLAPEACSVAFFQARGALGCSGSTCFDLLFC